MIKYFFLCLSVCLSGVLCDLNKAEGSDCEWDGVKGKCVEETRCFTTLVTRGEKHPVCSQKGEVNIICCTDCDLVNDTRSAVMSPRTGVFWKDGKGKARDHCLTYIDQLHYRCRDGGFYSGISRELNTEKNCHTTGLWGIGGAPSPGSEPGAKYPHQALLAYGADLEKAQWLAGGSIISDKYILTAAQVAKFVEDKGPLTFVAVDVKNRSDSPSSWQIRKVKRFIPYPEYQAPNKYHDIALIETETPITFNKNVLPACLIVEEVNTEKAVATTWFDLTSETPHQLVDTIQTINLEKFTDDECKAAYNGTSRMLRSGIDTNTMMCYGSKQNDTTACRGLAGEPLLVESQFDCVHAIIGVTSFGRYCGGKVALPDVYTKVAHYVPWIDSIVWL